MPSFLYPPTAFSKPLVAGIAKRIGEPLRPVQAAGKADPAVEILRGARIGGINLAFHRKHTRIVDYRIEIDGPLFEKRGRGDDLEGRSRRHGIVGSLVEQRKMRVVVEVVELLLGDVSPGEEVVVESRNPQHAQYLAGIGVQRNNSAAGRFHLGHARHQGVGDDLLQAEIDCQANPVPLAGRRCAVALNHLARCVFENGFRALDPAHVTFVQEFHP